MDEQLQSPAVRLGFMLRELECLAERCLVYESVLLMRSFEVCVQQRLLVGVKCKWRYRGRRLSNGKNVKSKAVYRCITCTSMRCICSYADA